MNRWIATFVLFFSFLGVMGHGFPCASANESGNTVEVDQGPTLSAADCHSSTSHHESSPFSEHCHSHAHCHCGFLISSSTLDVPSSNSLSKSIASNPYFNSHIENLFRPPIAV